MKFLELNNIIKTNILFSRLQAFNPKRTLEIEAYSCKNTKKEKKYKGIKKPLCFLISTLEIAFPDYDFSQESMDSFKVVNLQEVKIELSFVFFTLYKNHEDVRELIKYLDILLEQCIDVKISIFYSLEKNILCDSHNHKLFFIYDSKRKRIILLKLMENENA